MTRSHTFLPRDFDCQLRCLIPSGVRLPVRNLSAVYRYIVSVTILTICVPDSEYVNAVTSEAAMLGDG